MPAASLIHLLSPNPVQMAWKTHFVGHLRAVNNNLLDTYQLKSQNAVLDADLQSLRRLDDGRYAAGVAYRHASGEVEELIYDRVIACTGFAFDDSIFDRTCRPELAIHDRFPRQTSTWESVNVPGLYFAGTLTQERDYRQTTSAFIHGFRYNTRALHRILEVEHHGGEWPSRDLGTGPASVRDAVIERVNRTSALWQQFGFLADLVVVGERGVRYYEEVPVDYADGGCQMIVPGELYFLVTLEYGVEELTDPFNVERIARDDVDRAEQSRFLHPIVRGFRDGEQVSEHHVIEDLTAEWVEPIHTEPLGDFFARELAAPPPAMAREQARA